MFNESSSLHVDDSVKIILLVSVIEERRIGGSLTEGLKEFLLHIDAFQDRRISRESHGDLLPEEVFSAWFIDVIRYYLVELVIDML